MGAGGVLRQGMEFSEDVDVAGSLEPILVLIWGLSCFFLEILKALRPSCFSEDAVARFQA